MKAPAGISLTEMAFKLEELDRNETVTFISSYAVAQAVKRLLRTLGEGYLFSTGRHGDPGQWRTTVTYLDESNFPEFPLELGG